MINLALKVWAAFAAIVGAIAAVFALRHLRRNELLIIEDKRRRAEAVNAAKAEQLESEVRSMRAEVDKIHDRDELAKMLDE